MTTAQATSLLRGTSEPPPTIPPGPMSSPRAKRMAATEARHEGPRVRDPWISERALRERMSIPSRRRPTPPVPDLPPYAVAFLAHLRLLIGVPFDYLVPDRACSGRVDPLLPPRPLVDGPARRRGRSPSARSARANRHTTRPRPRTSGQLDEAEPGVRPLQRGLGTLEEPGDGRADAGQPITGLLLRSALVSGWPHMEVCAYADESSSRCCGSSASRRRC